MKLSKIFPLICLCISAISYAEEISDTNDIFLELASRKTSQEELKDSPQDELSRLISTSTPFFLILGENTFGFSQIKETIACAEGIISEYLGLKVNPNNKISLRIISYDDEKYDKQFYIETYNNSMMYLMLKWDKNLEYKAFNKFIIGAILRKLAQERKLGNDYEIPYFLELSLSLLLEERVKERASLSLAKKAREQRLLSLEDTLKIERNLGDKEQNELSAYWNLLSLNRFFKDKTKLQELCRKFLFGTKDFDLYKEISKIHTGKDLDNYLKCILNYELNSRTGRVLDMNESAEELLRLSFIRKDSTNTALGDKDILKYSEDEEVALAITKRITEIKLLLTKINPIYFNTLISLGEMFESALKGKENAFDDARLRFIEEFRYAKYLENRAKILLNR